MTETTLNSIAIDVVGQYGLVGKHLVQAYRLGTERVVSQMRDRYASMINSPALPLVNQSIRGSVVAANQQVADYFVGGVARATEQMDLAIDRMTQTATGSIKSLDTVGSRLGAAFGTPVASTVAQLHMPAAKISLQIADQLVEGSKRLVERIAGDEIVAIASVEAVEAVDAQTRAKRASDD